jgi:hypothetical protein
MADEIPPMVPSAEARLTPLCYPVSGNASALCPASEAVRLIYNAYYDGASAAVAAERARWVAALTEPSGELVEISAKAAFLAEETQRATVGIPPQDWGTLPRKFRFNWHDRISAALRAVAEALGEKP